MDKETLQERFDALSSVLLHWQNKDGFWTGELSSSALGVAVAGAALHFYDREANLHMIEKGMRWLSEHVNQDGGFGDTPESPSNISTSLLCYASLFLNRELYSGSSSILKKLSAYLNSQGIDLNSEDVSRAILTHYGKDYTFSVPILTMCALCGITGEEAFEHIPQLPFELALVPRSWLVSLSVVSYAVPALVAVGITIFKYKKKKNPLLKVVRRSSIGAAMRELESMLPASGGFLEAIPLTAFVALCLINAGFRDSAVVEKGICFLKETCRDDGSWPIDIDLSTWVSSLAVKSLGNQLPNVLDEKHQQKLTEHFLSIQNKSKHPFNGTSSGGWGWTNFSGSVPDGDDTPGVMLALMKLSETSSRKFYTEIENACDWLCRLQNSNGGFPTFTRGWGQLPFDQSCSDLTGHGVLALCRAMDYLGSTISKKKLKKYQRAIDRAISFLEKKQRNDGALLPLWFGNQHVSDHSNPVYGSARVVSYLQDALFVSKLSKNQRLSMEEIVRKGQSFLAGEQNIDGSWGGAKNIPGSIEETALALSALVNSVFQEHVDEGFLWLNQAVSEDRLEASPIGLYFASLWYHEKMYPLVMSLEAYSRAIQFIERK